MRQIAKILSPVVLLVFLTGCFDEPGTETLLTDTFVSLSVTSQQIGEADGDGEILIEISQAQSSDVSVSFDLTTSNSVEGVDFTLSASSVTIPAGSYSANIPFSVVDNNAFEPAARTFTVTLTDASGVKITGNTSVTVGILNDDCPSNTSVWYGDVTVDDVGYTSELGEGRANDNGDCDILIVSGNYVGAVYDVVWEFTPDAPGATSGTVVAQRQAYDCCEGQDYEYEAVGTYDETTGVISADYQFYTGGSPWFTGGTVITAN